DLDLYMIVAVSDFNMGAMENKGLNIFNTAFVLAHEKSATDSDFEDVERVIAHEYFHNWTGNRITCRDWFQLSLKEGLTVFRDQKFSESMQSEVVERINQVKIIRSAQFAEDSGPMAHPIRPDSYIEMNNFYTVTVYNKGAEVIRMMHTLVGEDGFRKGMDYYFDHFDGQAVTCEDFIQSMESANGVDWVLFRNWYSQSGTPKLKATLKTLTTNSKNGLDSSPNKKVILSFTQTAPSANTNSKGSDNKPYMIPIRTSLLQQDGTPIQIKAISNEKWQQEVLLILTDYQHEFELDINVSSDVDDCSYIPSLLRNFSAPVKLEYDYDIDQLTRLFAHDTDPFNRWDAGQTLMTRVLLSENQTISQSELDGIGLAFKNLINDSGLDNALKALAIQLPSLNSLIGEVESVDLDGLFLKHRQLKKFLAIKLQQQWLSIFNEYKNNNHASSGDRSLKNSALDYLLIADEAKHLPLAVEQQNSASNMTDEIAALQITCRSELLSHAELRAEQIARFLQKWRKEDLVLDKWFTAQALQNTPEVLENIKSLLSHECFSISNPNKVRALIGTFSAGNIPQFHCSTGSGYDFITYQVIQLNEVNAQMGARLVKQFSQWRKFDTKRQALIKDCLEQILALQNLSPDIFEIASKSLKG
ncbi:MAG: aminopeptidase N, partial [Kangiellaceae bacterium]|nr:aminopeptidase N [Kangiellaceae bacterium]